MKIVVAIDSLKGSLTSIQAGEAIEKGIKKYDLEAEVVIKPTCRWRRRNGRCSGRRYGR